MKEKIRKVKKVENLPNEKNWQIRKLYYKAPRRHDLPDYSKIQEEENRKIAEKMNMKEALKKEVEKQENEEKEIKEEKTKEISAVEAFRMRMSYKGPNIKQAPQITKKQEEDKER